MAKNRNSVMEANRQGRLELARLREKNEQRRAAYELELKLAENRANMHRPVPEQRSLDGRDYYSQLRETLTARMD